MQIYAYTYVYLKNLYSIHPFAYTYKHFNKHLTNYNTQSRRELKKQ